MKWRDSNCNRCELSAAPAACVKGCGGSFKTVDYVILKDCLLSPNKEKHLSSLLFDAIEQAEQSWQNWYLTNLVKCPLQGQDSPLQTSINACSRWLYRELYLTQPKKILLLGPKSAKLLTQNKITTLKRNTRRWEQITIGVPFAVWWEQWQNKCWPGTRKKLNKYYSEKECYTLACSMNLITEKPLTTWAMMGYTQKEILGYPELEDSIYEDIQYFIKADPAALTNSGSLAMFNSRDYLSNDFRNDSRLVFFDFETNSKDWRKVSKLGSSAIATGKEEIKIAYKNGTKDEQRNFKNKFAALQDKQKIKVAHNAAYDIKVARRLGVPIEPPYADTLMLVHLFAPHWKYKDLKSVTRLIVADMPEYDRDLADLKKNKTIINPKTGEDDYTLIPKQLQDYYVTGDLTALRLLFFKLWGKLTRKQKQLYKLECKFLELVVEMELNGIIYSVTKWKKYKATIDKKVSKLLKRLIKYDKTINWNSNQQLTKKYKIPSTDKIVLTRYQNKYKEFKLLAEYKEAAKIASTYLNKLPSQSIKYNTTHRKVQFDLNTTGARSGRLSASKPNMQNQPEAVRELFVSRFGKKGVIYLADASQLEDRMMAFVTRDPNLMKLYLHNQDRHQITSDILSKILQKDVPRSLGKTVNFAIGYGGSPDKLIELTGCSLRQAEKYLQALKKRYSTMLKYKYQTYDFIKQNGYVTTIFGFKRWFGFPVDQKLLGMACRAGFNTIIQSPSVHYIKRSAVYAWKLLQRDSILTKAINKNQILPILTVHDDVMFDIASRDIALDVHHYVKYAFEHPNNWSLKEFNIEFDVPFLVDGKIGQNWGKQNESNTSGLKEIETV